MTDRNELALLLEPLEQRRVQLLEFVISLLESLEVVSFAALLSVDDSSFCQMSRTVEEENKRRGLELRKSESWHP